ncbi:MAG: NADPH:quinone reductase [Candelina submexicana]|nr:MAG: NADPH:quinone reductase [Candelina submexicana]
MATSSSLPNTMKGVQISKTGGTEVLEYLTDLPIPEPKEGEILVKNDAVGINYIDTYFHLPLPPPISICRPNRHPLTSSTTTYSYFRTGLYPSPLPLILGREAEGHITSLGPSGNMYGLSPGDRVVWIGTSSYAEYTATPADKAIKIPEGIPKTHAAAALLQGLTALTLVREAHPVQKGEWILVHAAAGGVGLWLCQILRAIGARTIGTASTVEKRELARKNGAEILIDYSKEDVVQRVEEITGGEGVAAVFDGVGKSTFDSSLECLKRKGSMVSFGNASGAVPPFTIARLGAKNIKLSRTSLPNSITTREEFEHYTKELFDLMISAKMNVQIHEMYPMKDVARAHSDLEGRKTTGKLLLRP